MQSLSRVNVTGLYRKYLSLQNNKKNVEMSLKTGFAQIFSCCPKNFGCPKFGGVAASLAPPVRTPMKKRQFQTAFEDTPAILTGIEQKYSSSCLIFSILPNFFETKTNFPQNYNVFSGVQAKYHRWQQRSQNGNHTLKIAIGDEGLLYRWLCLTLPL